MMEATLTMRPPPSASMARTTYLVRTMGASVFRCTSRSMRAVSMSASAPSKPTAALLTSPHSGPTSWRTRLTSCGMSAISARSKGTKWSEPGRSRSAASMAAAHVDRAVAAAHEVVAVVVPLDHVAGVHEAVAVTERRRPGPEIMGRRPRRADPQRAVHDLQLHRAGLTDPRRRKARQAVVDLERHAGLRRGERVAEAGGRIDVAQPVEHGLVGDLAREAHVARRQPGGEGAHQRPPPVRRRA